MLASTPQFAAMIDGRDQVVAYDVALDLPGGIYPSLALAVTQLEIDASIDTDIPDGTRLEEGFSAIAGSFTVSGQVDPDDETKTASWLLGRYPTKASDGSVTPLEHTDLLMARAVITLGLYPEGAGDEAEEKVVLVGKVEDYGRDGTGAVKFNIIDLRQEFRGKAEIAAVITAPPFNAGMTNEFAVDCVLRQQSGGAISSWPAQRPECVLAVGFRTSLWPEVGTLDTTADIPSPVFGPGAFGSAFSYASFDINARFLEFEAVPYTLDRPVETNLYVEWFNSPDNGGVVFVGSEAGTDVDVDWEAVTISRANTADLLIEFTDNAGHVLDFYNWSIPDYSPAFTAAKITLPAAGGTGWSATLYCGNQVQATGARSLSSPRGDGTWGRAAVESIGAEGASSGLAGLQVTTEASPTPNNDFVPRAVLDPSFNRLIAMPKISAGDGWQAIQDMAASELAVAGFEGDVFRYLNRRTLAQSASVRTITSDDALLAIAESSSAAGVVNRAQIGWTPWQFATARTTVWEAATKIRVPAHDSYTTTIQLDGYAANVDSAAEVLPDLSGDTTHSWFRASTDADGTAEHHGVTVTITQKTPDTLTITAVNSRSRDAWLVSPTGYSDVLAGTVLLRVAALVVTQGEEQLTDYQWPPPESGGAASSRFGEMPFTMSGNQFVQVEDCAVQLGRDIVTAGYVPCPDLLDCSIKFDPRLQRCDRVQLIDSDRTGINAYALIFGYKITYEAGGGDGGGDKLEMSIDARAIAPPGGWIGGVDGFSEGGVTTYGY